MIVFNVPQPEQPQPEIPPKRRRLMADLHTLETMLRAIDLHELQDAIDEQVAQFPEWQKTADPHQRRGVIYAITAQQIVLLTACQVLSARKELPCPQK